MSLSKRILLALAILVLHYVVIIVPVAELFIGYVIIFNPLWLRNFLNHMANPEDVVAES